MPHESRSRSRHTLAESAESGVNVCEFRIYSSASRTTHAATSVTRKITARTMISQLVLDSRHASYKTNISLRSFADESRLRSPELNHIVVSLLNSDSARRLLLHCTLSAYYSCLRQAQLLVSNPAHRRLGQQSKPGR